MTFFSSFGSFGQEQNFKLLFDGRQAWLQCVELGLSHLLHVRIGVGEHGLGFGDAFLDLAILAELLDGRFHVAVLLGDGLELLLVVDQRGVGHLSAEVFVAGFELVEAVEHGVLHYGKVIMVVRGFTRTGERRS